VRDLGEGRRRERQRCNDGEHFSSSRGRFPHQGQQGFRSAGGMGMIGQPSFGVWGYAPAGGH
jgi:hypothetical protein